MMSSRLPQLSCRPCTPQGALESSTMAYRVYALHKQDQVCQSQEEAEQISSQVALHLPVNHFVM